ncbi:unnamed protein product [Brassicogethes aeneus]|uniref:Uncharacterized protein n=1 Tax=Brassicogethes aeneus TaxID=1431903 RepID=A0A9P0BK68_BRAAE|nr:unnamed protein product [Brassicogethes aeneus]
MSTATNSTSTNSTSTNLSSELQEVNFVNEFGSEVELKVDCNTEYFWHTFRVPWNVLSNTEHEQLKNGICSKVSKSKLVHGIVDEMRQLKKYIPSKAFKVISHQVVSKYPKALRDQDEDGIILGDGTHSFFSKLQERNNYLNRPHKRHHKDNSKEQSPILIKKKYVSARAGCSNWSPNSLIEQNVNEIITPLDNSFEELMTKSFPEQRHFLNSTPAPTSSQIREEWPILMSINGIRWHFDELKKSNLNSFDNINDKCDKVVSFITKKNKSVLGENEPVNSDILMLICLAKHFKENMELFYKQTQEAELDKSQIPSTAFIHHVCNDDIENAQYYVY